MNDLFSYLELNKQIVASIGIVIVVLWITFERIKYYREIKNKKGDKK
jgi:hypothetical protein